MKIIQLERLELGSECQSEPGRGESNMRYTISLIVIHQLVAAGRLQILFTFNKFQCNLSVSSLICYTDLEAVNFEFCNEDDGYNTCFASYNKSKALIH